jgi:5-methylcytosine-specific restriction endonuclease McrA
MHARRKKFTRDEQNLVRYRHAYRCARCDVLLPPCSHIDHIKPLHEFGPDDFAEANHPDNLQPLCPGCHAAKSQLERIRRNVHRSCWLQAERGLPCNNCGAVHSKYFLPPACLEEGGEGRRMST